MDLVVVGRIGGPAGTKGAFRLKSSTQPPENLLNYRPWLIGEGEAYRPVDVQSVRPHGTGFVAQIAGVTDRDAAQALSGLLIAVPRAALPALEPGREYYWQDLFGMTVHDAAGRRLGIVRRLLETGAHDVLVVEEEGRETLIPFTEPFVLDVDLEARRIQVDWQEPV